MQQVNRRTDGRTDTQTRTDTDMEIQPPCPAHKGVLMYAHCAGVQRQFDDHLLSTFGTDGLSGFTLRRTPIIFFIIYVYTMCRYAFPRVLEKERGEIERERQRDGSVSTIVATVQPFGSPTTVHCHTPLDFNTNTKYTLSLFHFQIL